MTVHDPERRESMAETDAPVVDARSVGGLAKHGSYGADHPDELFRRLDGLRRQARRLLWTYGISSVVISLISLTTLAALIDWLFQIDDTIVRLFMGAAILTITGIVAWKSLIGPLREPLTNLALARRCERLDPTWKDQLSSVVQFLEANFDPALGSPGLQKQVVRETLTRLPRLDMGEVLQSRPVLGVAWTAIGVLLFALLLVVLDQASAALAIERLVRPFSGIHWPRQVDLALQDEHWRDWETQTAQRRVVHGEPLQIFVENRLGPLPESVVLTVRSAKGEVREESIRRLSIPDPQKRLRDVAAATLLLEPGVWSLRAAGGDDDEMAWQTLEVIPPPAIEDMQMTLTPPPYAGLPATTFAPETMRIQGLIGAQIDIRGRTNRPLTAAFLRIKNRPPLPLEIDADGMNVKLQFSIDEPGRYTVWFDLKDREGFQDPNARRYEIEGQIDAVPDVTLLQPRDDLTVTADAVIPLEIQVRDDRGIKQLLLEYYLGESGSESPIRHSLTGVLGGNESAKADAQRELTWKDDWPLSSLSLSEGMRLTFLAAADDFYDLGPDHTGRSRSRTLHVISTSQKQAELAGRQEQILKNLLDVQRLQVRSREEIRELNLQWQSVGELRPEDFDKYRRVEREQQQIAKQLFGPVTSVHQLAAEWLTDYNNNRLAADEMQKRVVELVQELDWLNREIYPALDNELTQVGKRLGERSSKTPASSNAVEKTPKQIQPGRSVNEKEEEPPKDSSSSVIPPTSDNNGDTDDQSGAQEIVDPGIREAQSDSAQVGDEPANTEPEREKFSSSAPRNSLARIEDYQTSAIETLEELVDTISDWKDLQTVTAEWQELIESQNEISAQSAELGRQTLTKKIHQLAVQERAELTKTAEKQHNIAERLQQFKDRLSQELLTEAKPDDKERDLLQELSDELSSSPLSGKMQEAESSIRRNELGQAATTQSEIEKELEDLHNLLQQRQETDTETLIKKIKQFEEATEELRKQQQDLTRDVESLTPSEPGAEQPKPSEDERDKLVKKQQKNAEQASRLSHRLKRAGLDESREPLRRATEEMKQAVADLMADRLEQLRKRKDQIEQSLEQGQRELAKARRKLETQLAREMLARLEQEVQGLIERQASIVVEIARLRAEFDLKQRLNRAQLKTLRDTADGQDRLQVDTRQIAERLREAPVFSYALNGAAESMQATVTRLRERLVDQQAVESAEAARRQLLDLLTALASPERKEGSSENAVIDGGGSQAQLPHAPEIPQASQVRLLKQLQTEIREKTARWHDRQGTQPELSQEARAERDRLTTQQQALLELAQLLLKSLATWDPDAVPAESSEPDGDQPDAPAADSDNNEDQQSTDPTIDENKNDNNDSGEKSSSRSNDSGIDTSQSQASSQRNVFAFQQSPPPDPTPPEKPEIPEDSGDNARASALSAVMDLQKLATSILEAMQGAERKLSAGEAGSSTQENQQQAEQAIDELLKQLDQMSQQQPNSDENSQSDEKQSQAEGEKSKAKDEKEESGTESSNSRRQDDQPQNSTENISKGKSGEEKLSVPQKLAKEVWGHLPDSVRDQMLTLFSEKYLPRYEDLIRRYYEALADEEQSDR
ncbi:MAG: hypothetical protein ACKVT0_17980 [Planctomycetaceae bacterium]